MNPDFQNAINQLKAELEFLENEVQSCVQERDFKFAMYYQTAIWQTHKELGLLNSFAEKKHFIDAQVIDDALTALFAGQIKSFSLVSQPYKDFYLNFSVEEKGIIICELPTEKELCNAETYYYAPEHTQKILSLGFKESGSENRLNIRLKQAPNKSCVDIKTLMAILVFEVFQLNIKRSFYLIIKDK